MAGNGLLSKRRWQSVPWCVHPLNSPPVSQVYLQYPHQESGFSFLPDNLFSGNNAIAVVAEECRTAF
jgi:hypothetical protein